MLLGVVTFDHCSHTQPIEQRWWGGPYAWHIVEATPAYEPIPYRGALGFFPVTLMPQKEGQ